MLASFFDWNDKQDYLVPENAVLYLSHRQYELIMMALKTSAVENYIYSEVAEIVQLISSIEESYKWSRDKEISKQS